MQYYVLLCFDSIKQIDEIQANLENRFELVHNIFPHLTLTVFDSHEGKETRNVMRFLEIIPFRVVLKTKGIWVFKGEEN
jgi:2'-5' RNA ligase